ncbi:MAG TPA: uroporphyrinogen decarboxylase family protein [bacterium]|nr:uroporphyrinogen decarboxylase family protein [bacterium]
MKINFRDEMRKIFSGDPSAKVVWQPRIEHWFNMNQKRGTLPAQFRNATVYDVFERLNASIRYLPSWAPVNDVYDSDIRYTSEETPESIIQTWKTPVGEVRRVDRKTIDSFLPREYPLKNPDDLRVIEYVIEGTEYKADVDFYISEQTKFADWAVPTALMPRVNLMRIFLEFSGFEQGIYFLHDRPEDIRGLVRLIDQADLRYCRELLKVPAEFINYGDNVHCDMLPPPLLKEYVMPSYHQRNEIFHAAGKFTYSHWDGDVRTILPYARETGMDGLEAITFKPMGDATYEMVEQYMGADLVLVDGICAISFLPNVSMEEFEREVRELVERLHPHLVLGISDEAPPDSEFHKLERVSEIVEEYNRADS